jgi:hypothetical protein
MLTAINKDTPDPKPYPFWSISSNKITIKPEAVNCKTIKEALTTPIV